MSQNICEACGAEGGYIYHIAVTSPKTEIDINFCKRHYKLVTTGYTTTEDLIYIHNNFLKGNRKQFLE